MGLILGGLAALSIFVFIWGEIMRAPLPRLDLLLASAAASPIATEGLVIATAAGAARTAPGMRFFNAPILEFTWSGIPVFLTAPDALAFASSLVLLIRFFAWAIAPLVARRKSEGDK
jgi:hypothetical protein